VPLFRRKPRAHRVVVLQLGADGDDPSFMALCDCGWNTLPRATYEEALSDAHGHDENVVEEVQPPLGEGGVGWLCLFCGAPIDEGPIRLSATWGTGEREREQWFAAHRECLIERASPDARDGPLFDG
jgi:hypothetical protein